jgi:hypothetical protein
MLRQMPKQYSFHSKLYNKIPEKHMLKKVLRSVGFSFINSLLEAFTVKLWQARKRARDDV